MRLMTCDGCGTAHPLSNDYYVAVVATGNPYLCGECIDALAEMRKIVPSIAAAVGVLLIARDVGTSVVEKEARPRCEGCGEEIDPETCGCGGEQNDAEHSEPWGYTHPFVPMGCDCFRTDEASRAKVAAFRASKKPVPDDEHVAVVPDDEAGS